MADEVWRIRVEAEDNLEQLRARIAAARAAATQLGAAPYGGTPQAAADQAALNTARATMELARAQDRAAFSGLNHGQRVAYLRNQLDMLTPGTIRYYDAQTRLNNEIQRGTTISEVFSRQLMRIGVGLLVWTTIRAVQQSIQEQIAALREYELEVSRFAAITDQSVESATQAWDKYARIAVRAGVTPMQAAPVIRIAEQTAGETDQTRQQFVRTTTQLEELTGVSSEKIGRGLSSALKQAGKGLEEVQHMGDLVASTLARIPATNIDEVIAALQEAAPLAQLWGTSFDEAFNIIVEGSARAQESPEQIATSFQRLSKGLNQIAEGGAAAWERQRRLLKDFNIDVNDASNNLRPIPEILGEIARALPNLSAPRQQALLETVAGGSLRPEQTRNILGGISAFNADLSGAIEKLNGTLDRMTNIIDQSLGQTVKVMDARIAQLKEKGGILENILAWILRQTIGEIGGKQGAQAVTNIVEASTANVTGAGQKQDFLKNIIDRAQGDPEKVKQYVKEHNDAVKASLTKARQDMGEFWYATFYGGAAEEYARGLTITDEDLASTIVAGGQRIQGAATQRLASERRVQGQMSQVRTIEAQAMRAAPTEAPAAPLSELAKKIKTTMISQGGALTGEDFFPGMDTVNAQFDATKMTTDEINQARQQSIILVQQELAAHRQFLEAQGLEKDEINAIIKMEKDRLDLSYLQVRAKGQLLSLTSEEAARFQQAASDIAEKKQEAASNFQFQRLRNIEPSQFGQLQALTQMYNQFLTNIGSPEKTQHINLLLGENNTFKTMNARMTALQLAIEDLTKTEKAQLSGTWNLPAGATALVPISSLDIQRWNKSGGGGLSEEAIRALLGATSQSGDQVSSSMQTAANRIVAAIQESAAKSGLTSEKISSAKTIPEAVNATRDELLSRVSQALAMKEQVNAEMRRTLGMKTPTQDYEDASERDYRLRRLPAADQATAALKTAAQAANVTVSALPVKAVFNANISVMLNGAVVARTIIPILYNLITKMTASTGTRPKGVVR